MGFAESITQALEGAHIPPWLIVALVALMPFIEMRGAVPIAVLIFGWSLPAALLFTGPISLFPGLVIALYLHRLEPRLRKVKFFDKWLDKAFAWTRKKNATPEDQEKHDRRATILLALLVAIPGPGTGAWTGGLVSYVFEVPKKKAVIALVLGVLGEAVAMGLLVMAFQWSVGSLP
jgi:uncharacterized membrane protein